MESSKITNQEVINLGKAIIAELGMEIECNTPARWLVHYIAENIHRAENSIGKDKDIAEINCVDAILKLWHHRSELPRSIRPFADFDSVFRGLSRLNSSGRGHYYNEFSQFEQEIDNDESSETKQWVKVALAVDRAAKELVLESFEVAAQAALTEKSKNILQQVPESAGDDIKIMLSFVGEVNDETKLRENEVAEVKSKIQKVESLKAICDVFLEKFKNDLEVIAAKDVSKR